MEVAHILFTGMVAFGSSPDANEELALLVKEGGGAPHQVENLAHRPRLEFECDDLVGLGVAERDASGSVVVRDIRSIPCDVIFSDSALEHAEERFPKGVDLLAGFDVFLLPGGAPQRRDSLVKIDCETPQQVVVCNCFQGQGKFCSFNKILQATELQPKAKRLRREFFERKLAPQASDHVVARVPISDGRIGSVVDKRNEWLLIKAKDSIGDSRRPEDRQVRRVIPIRVAWDIEWEPNIHRSSELDLAFLPHEDSAMGFSLRFKADEDGLHLLITNEPSLEDVCRIGDCSADAHFNRFLALSDHFGDLLPAFLRPERLTKAECAEITLETIEELAGGKYPIICLSPEMAGHQIGL